MKTAFIITITSLIVIASACELQSIASAKRERSSQQQDTLEVMTCNTGDLSSRKRINTRKLAAFLESCATPDILFLQEIRGEGEAKAIAQRFRMQHYLFMNDRKKEYGVAIISKWPLLNPDQIYFKKSPRGYGALSADIILNSVRVQLVNVHLDRGDGIKSENGNVKFDMKYALKFLHDEMNIDTVRSRSAMELIVWLKQKGAEQIILGGDFNTIPQSKSVQIMKSMFNDALCPSLSCFQGTYTRLNAPFPVRIDYIFHTPSLTRLETEIIRKSPGDHYPVIARFSLPCPPALSSPP